MVESKRGENFRNLDLSIEQLNNTNNDNEDEDVINDSIEQCLDEDGMDNYQDNDDNNEHINGRRN